MNQSVGRMIPSGSGTVQPPAPSPPEERLAKYAKLVPDFSEGAKSKAKGKGMGKGGLTGPVLPPWPEPRRRT